MSNSNNPRVTVDCHVCGARVKAEVLANAVTYIDTDYPSNPEYRVSFAQCPDCRSVIVARQAWAGPLPNGDPDNWEKAYRAWPKPDREPSESIPAIVAVSLEEANRCHIAGAHTACAVMCGRALEGICVYFKTAKTLAKGLKELREKNIIDEKLYSWSEELRQQRNLGAHASEDKVSKEDAADLVDFLNAICDYVFVISEQFNEFMRRKAPPKDEALFTT